MLPFFLIALLLPAAQPGYRESIERWRAEQEQSLASDTGWLTVAGLTWLEEGMNEVELPAAAPPFGRFELRQGKVYFHPAEGGLPIEMAPDSSGKPTIIERGPIAVHVIQRGRRTGIRLRDRNSRFRREFTGRKWYPVNEAWRIEAKWTSYDPPKLIRIRDILGDETEARAPGYAEFELNGQRLRLEPTGERRLFFVFKDLTSGKETYGGGRFLYAGPPKDGKVVLDFNKAYNPPCAFTPYTTCPLPPRQNHLPVRIEAGELNYRGHR